MHIRHFIFASISFFAIGLSACLSAVSASFEFAREHWPPFLASADETIALDAACHEAEATSSPLARFHAFLERALRHARYSAGGFVQTDCYAQG